MYMVLAHIEILLHVVLYYQVLWFLTSLITCCIVISSNMVTNTYRDVITCGIVLSSNMITNTFRTAIMLVI